MFFFSSFLAKEKKNQKEKTRFLRQWGVSPRARGDKGYAPLTGGTSPVRARIGVCEHGAANINLSFYNSFTKPYSDKYSVNGGNNLSSVYKFSETVARICVQK